MNSNIAFLFVYLATCLFIGLLFYAIFRREIELPTYKISNGPSSISVKKKYDGVPGMSKGEPLPQPTMPKPPSPLIVRTSYSQIV